jgi:hypothetical protein
MAARHTGESPRCPSDGCDHRECVEQQYLRAQLAYWKDRCERAENALVLATDHGMPAW